MKDFSRALRSGYLSAVAKLVSGSVAGQVIALVAMVGVTRLYSTTQLGLLAFSVAVSTVLSVLATGRYEFAVMNPERERDAGMVVVAAAVLGLAFGLLIALIVMLGTDQLAILDPKLRALGWSIAALTVAQALFSVAMKWANRSGAYGSITLALVVVALLSNVGPLLVPLVGAAPSEKHLIFFFGLAQLAGVATILASTGKGLFEAMRGSTVAEVGAIVRRYWRFPAFTLPHSLASKLTPEIPILFLTAFFGPSLAGVFSIARRALNQPMYLLASNVGNVFHRRLADNPGANSLRREIRIIVTTMAVVMIPIAFVIVGWGEALFALMFGESFAVSGRIAQILLPMLALRMMAAPVAYVFMVFEEQWRMLALQLLHIALVSISFFVGHLLDDLWLAFWLYTASSSLIYAVTVLLARKVASTDRPNRGVLGNA